MSGFSSFSVAQNISGSSKALRGLLDANDLEPGDQPSYSICKDIYLYHVLGAKIAEAPITMAQSQEREVTIQDAPDEVKKAYLVEWEALEADQNILNVHALARVYGISSLVMGVKGLASNVPADMETLYKQDVYFNTLDPLNTSGSLVLSQDPNDPGFQRPIAVSTGSQTYHPSRTRVVMNERPVFIAYTTSAFGFVGRSVYQRILFPLKGYLLSMIANNLVQGKLGAIVAQMEQPGSVVNKSMQAVNAVKRWLIKLMQTGNVLAVGKDETITTLDMTNVDGAGTYSRGNIMKDIATGADMPAILIENETLAEGFGEGTEDSKKIAQFVGRFRIKMRPEYKWFDNIVQYRAWNPEWYKRVIQAKYPEAFGSVDFKVAFMQWRQDFQAEWPSLLEEPESEQAKIEAVKLEAVVAILNTLLNILDPANKAKLVQWASDCFGENKRLFPYELELDWDEFANFAQESQDKEDESHESELESNGAKKPFPSFDSANISKLKDAVAAMMEKPERLKAERRAKLAAV